MYAKIVFMVIIKKENGLKENLEILMNEVIGISIVKKRKSIILGVNIKDVLKLKF